MTSAWKPTPGRDALTRYWRRATEIKRFSAEPDDCVLSGLVDGVRLTWTEDGHYYGSKVPAPLDLVADADPLPAPGPVRERTVKEIVPGVYNRLQVVGYSPSDGSVSLCLLDMNGGQASLDYGFTRAELTDAIATLTAIRDAMEDKP